MAQERAGRPIAESAPKATPRTVGQRRFPFGGFPARRTRQSHSPRVVRDRPRLAVPRMRSSRGQPRAPTTLFDYQRRGTLVVASRASHSLRAILLLSLLHNPYYTSPHVDGQTETRPTTDDVGDDDALANGGQSPLLSAP